MFRKLVKTAKLQVHDRVYSVRYYEVSTLRGGRRYSSEITLGPGDQIILDDDSLNNIESRMSALVPATIYSRLLAARSTAAA